LQQTLNSEVHGSKDVLMLRRWSWLAGGCRRIGGWRLPGDQGAQIQHRRL